MMYKITRNNLNRIQLSIERIKKNTEDYDLDSVPVIIADVEHAQIISPENKILEKAYLTSFGAVKGNISYENSIYHLIVLNFKYIEMFDLSIEELDGVLSHELGHIFNKYKFEIVPTYLDLIGGKASIEDIEKIKKNNRNNNEFYADHFSKITRNSEGLIRCINKFIKSEFCDNEDLFTLRIAALNSDQIYRGEVHRAHL